MSGGAAEKTEQPTPRRLREARRKGQIPLGKDLASAASLAAAGGALALTGSRLADLARGSIVAAIERATTAEGLDAASAVARVDAALWDVVSAAIPVGVAALVAGTLVSALQTGGAVTASALAPKPERLNPIAGLKRLVQLRTVVEAGKTWVKLAAVAVAAGSAVAAYRSELGGWLANGGEPAFALVFAIVKSAALRTAALLLLLGGVDVLLQRRLHSRELRMSKDEVRRDHKEDEGDPHVKHARRQLHRELATERMVSAVRSSSFVAVNPTHLATAIRYDEDGADAPRVVAKGAGEVARRIRRAAEAAGVEVIRDKPLARALYRVPLDAEIPEVLYAAVAEVLAHLREIDDYRPKTPRK